MAFVVPNVVRFSINQTFGEKIVANIVDYSLSDPGVPIERAGTCEHLAEQIADSWTANILPFCVNNLRCESISWVDLDDANGSTGTSTGGTESWPEQGSSVAQPLPPNVALLIHKNTSGAQRGKRRGRLYLCGMTEGVNVDDTPSLVGTTPAADLNAALALFLSETTADVDTFTVNMVVTHVLTRGPDTSEGKPGPPLTGDSSVVTSLTVDTTLATQRRRLR